MVNYRLSDFSSDKQTRKSGLRAIHNQQYEPAFSVSNLAFKASLQITFTASLQTINSLYNEQDAFEPLHFCNGVKNYPPNPK